jgi:hypothetical protein
MVYTNIKSSSALMLSFFRRELLSLMRSSSHYWILVIVGFSSKVFTIGAKSEKKEELKSMY